MKLAFYLVAFLAVALTIAALMLSFQTEGPGYAAAAAGIAAVGGFLAYRLSR